MIEAVVERIIMNIHRCDKMPSGMLANAKTIEAIRKALDFPEWNGVGFKPIYLFYGIPFLYDESMPDGEVGFIHRKDFEERFI